MPDPDDPSPAGEQQEHAQPEGDAPNLGPTSDPSGRDFGDSAGYGSGGSTRDYQEVVGENPVTAGRPNPLDAVTRRSHRAARVRIGKARTPPTDRKAAPVSKIRAGCVSADIPAFVWNREGFRPARTGTLAPRPAMPFMAPPKAGPQPPPDAYEPAWLDERRPRTDIPRSDGADCRNW